MVNCCVCIDRDLFGETLLQKNKRVLQDVKPSFVMRDASSEINQIKAYDLTLECQEHKNTVEKLFMAIHQFSHDVNLLTNPEG